MENEMWVIESRKHRYLCSKFAYVCKKEILKWSAVEASDVRIFDSKEKALNFLDKKWMKYGDKVNQWKPIEIQKAKRFDEYFVNRNVFQKMTERRKKRASL